MGCAHKKKQNEKHNNIIYKILKYVINLKVYLSVSNKKNVWDLPYQIFKVTL